MKVSVLLENLTDKSVELGSRQIHRLSSSISKELEAVERSSRVAYSCLVKRLRSEFLSIALLLNTVTDDIELLERSLGSVLTQLYNKLSHQRKLNEKGVLYKYE